MFKLMRRPQYSPIANFFVCYMRHSSRPYTCTSYHTFRSSLERTAKFNTWPIRTGAERSILIPRKHYCCTEYTTCVYYITYYYSPVLDPHDKHGENATYHTRQRMQKWGILWVHSLACTTAVQSRVDALMNFNRWFARDNITVLKWTAFTVH